MIVIKKLISICHRLHIYLEMDFPENDSVISKVSLLCLQKIALNSNLVAHYNSLTTHISLLTYLPHFGKVHIEIDSHLSVSIWKKRLQWQPNALTKHRKLGVLNSPFHSVKISTIWLTFQNIFSFYYVSFHYCTPSFTFLFCVCVVLFNYVNNQYSFCFINIHHSRNGPSQLISALMNIH